MRVLDEQEIEQVSGGIVPIIGAVIAAIGHFTARGVITSFAGRAGVVLATYEVAKWADR